MLRRTILNRNLDCLCDFESEKSFFVCPSFDDHDSPIEALLAFASLNVGRLLRNGDYHFP